MSFTDPGWNLVGRNNGNGNLTSSNSQTNQTIVSTVDTLTFGDQFTIGSTTYTFEGTANAGATSGFVATSGGQRFYFTKSPMPGAGTAVTNINDVGSLSVCFLAGTMIRTPTGEVAVETLRPGDLVLTLDGRAEPVVFVGRQVISSRFSQPETTNPILIRAGALGGNLPERDLRVSPHHAIVIDGVQCFAQALVNGTTIKQIAAPGETFEYFSVELTNHEIILAEGQPVESFADNVPRELFSNHTEFLAMFPNGREVGEMDLPHAKSRRQVPAVILARIAAQAQSMAATPDQAAA